MNNQKSLDEILKKQFFNTNMFLNHNINKFILLMWKGVYPYEYKDWGKFNETSLPEKNFLQSPKYQRYYWYRLYASKNILWRF